LLFHISLKDLALFNEEKETGFRDETDRVRVTRIVISYQSKRFSRIDWFDGSKMLVTFCDLKRELHDDE
jgi:hypothetical protein